MVMDVMMVIMMLVVILIVIARMETGDQHGDGRDGDGDSDGQDGDRRPTYSLNLHYPYQVKVLVFNQHG